MGEKRAVRGRLRDVISSFLRRRGGLLGIRRYVQVLLYRLFPLSFFYFLCFSYFPFHSVRGGAVNWGAGERGAPV